MEHLRPHEDPEFAKQERVYFQYMLKKGGVSYVSAIQRRTWLHYTWSLNIARVLLDMGADVKARDVDGDTPLHCAICRNELVASLYIERGADVNTPNNHGTTPLDYAMVMGHPLPVYTLLRHSARRGKPNSAWGKKIECIYTSVEALVVLCVPLSLPKCVMSTWLPRDVLRVLHGHLL